MNRMNKGRQLEGSRFLNPDDYGWEETGTKGFLTKTLFEVPESGESTVLMRISPGAFFPKHAHDHLEEIFVLEGDFFDEERSYTAGQYCQRAVKAGHTTGSKNGCTVLVVYRP